MPIPFRTSTLIVLSILVAACDSGEVAVQTEAANLAAEVELDGLMERVSERPYREQTQFFGDHVWMIDGNRRLFESNDAGYTWEPATLPAAGYITYMQFEDGGRLGLVVTEHGVMMRTEDSGQNWTQTKLDDHIGEGVDTEWGAYYYDISFDATLQTGTWVDYCQIFMTTDGGVSWTRHADALQDNDKDLLCVNRAVVDKDTGLFLADVDVGGRILTSGSYLFRSDDAGASWQEICSLDEVGLIIKSIKSCYDDVENMPALFLDLDDDPNFGDSETVAVFSENAYRGIFIDGSLRIPNTMMDRTDWTSLAKDSSSNRMWYDNGEDLAYTDDLGQSWQVISMGMPGNENLDFSFGLDRGYGVLQGEYLAVTEDLGKTWQVLNDSPAWVYDFAVLPQHNRIVVVFEENLALLDTETRAWTSIPDVANVNYLVVAGEVLWGIDDDAEIYRSEDAGLNWSKLEFDDMQEYFYIEGAVCDADNCVLWGEGEYEAVARLSANPAQFEITELYDQVSDLDEEYIIETIFDADLQRGWIATDYGGVYGTQDGGRSWDKLGSIRDELFEFSRAPGGSFLIARGYADTYLWSADGVDFKAMRAPIGSDGYLTSLCWLNDTVAIMAAEDEDGTELNLASTDGGYTWGPTTWQSSYDDCVIPGGLVTLNGALAVLK